MASKKISPKTAKNVAALAGEKPVKMPPRLELDSDLLPDIKGWEVGKTYSIVVSAKMMSKRQGDPYDMGEANDKSEVSAAFRIVSAQPEEAD